MKAKYYFPLSLVIFTIALWFVPTGFIPDSNLGSNLVTIITFLYGILAGFYIVVTTTDYNSFKAVVAEETAGWVTLYRNMILYDRRAAARLANLIDAYVIRSFDLEIIEYVRLTRPEFAQVELFIRRVRQRERQASIFEKIHDTLDSIIAKRQMLTVLSTRTLSAFQWAVLYILSALLILALFGIRDGHLYADIVAVAVSSSVVLILVLVRELDLFLWNEKSFGYDAYENVLTSIGKLPYYPDQTIDSRRITITEPIYRVGVRIDRHDPLSKRRMRIVGRADERQSRRTKRRVRRKR